MKLSFFLPKAEALKRFLQAEGKCDFTYAEVGDSMEDQVLGYDNDHRSVLIGEGMEVWKVAKTLLSTWQHFPQGWTKIRPDASPVVAGQNVAVMIRIMGVWLVNSARIVYVFDEPDRFGFAYGTLPGHAEIGEECFWIEKDAKGKITYHIKAFSRPRFWLARLGYPLARWYQRRFVRQSLQQVADLVSKN